jgi:myo-inositol-1(or 4)-monophosphatase
MSAVPADLLKLLESIANAASDAFDDARRRHDTTYLATEIGLGGDGTPTSRLDEIVDHAVLAAAAPFGVNILSEEAGWVDRGSAYTLAVDPVDGTANALAGVPICTFSAAVVVDGIPTSALTRWLDVGRDYAVTQGENAGPAWRTTGRTSLKGAAVSLLRPQRANREAWWAITEAAARIRILSCSTFESILVCQAATDAFVDAGGDVHRYVDLVAAQVYADAAGAVVGDIRGRSVEFDIDLTRRWSGVVAATPELLAEIQAATTPSLFYSGTNGGD